jgi:hypothetical protein
VNQRERLVARAADPVGDPNALGHHAVANDEDALLPSIVQRDHAVSYSGSQPIEHQSLERQSLEHRRAGRQQRQ